MIFFRRTGRKNNKYRYLTTKEAESIPCDRLLVYLIGPFKIIREGHNYPFLLKTKLCRWVLLLLPKSSAWQTERWQREENQSKICGLVQYPYSMYWSGYGWGSVIATAQFKNAETNTINIWVLTYFLMQLQEQCMNNKNLCVFQENTNILRIYIWYYRYKQGLSNVSKYVFTQVLLVWK